MMCNVSMLLYWFSNERGGEGGGGVNHLPPLFCKSVYSQFSKHLIQDLDRSIALNKCFVLAQNYEKRLLKLNSLKRIKVYCLPFKINYLLYYFTSVEFTELTVAIH